LCSFETTNKKDLGKNKRPNFGLYNFETTNKKDLGKNKRPNFEFFTHVKIRGGISDIMSD